jgi:hypothetical protein
MMISSRLVLLVDGHDNLNSPSHVICVLLLLLLSMRHMLVLPVEYLTSLSRSMPNGTIGIITEAVFAEQWKRPLTRWTAGLSRVLGPIDRPRSTE